MNFHYRGKLKENRHFLIFPDKYIKCIHTCIYFEIDRDIYMPIYVSTNTYSMTSPILNMNDWKTTFLGMVKSYMSIYFFFDISYWREKIYYKVRARIREGNGTPLQYSCLENPMDGGAWWAAVHGVTRSQTRLSDFTLTFHFQALEKEIENPLQCSCLEDPRDGGDWWAAVSGVAQSWTRLKRLT